MSLFKYVKLRFENIDDYNSLFYETITEEMDIIDSFLLVYEESGNSCEYTARCLSWVLYSFGKDGKIPQNFFKLLKYEEPHISHKNKIFEFFPCEKENIFFIEKEIRKYLKLREYIGIELTDYESERKRHNLSIDHVFVLTELKGKLEIIHSYSGQFGTRKETFSMEKFSDLLKSPEKWNSFFKVNIGYGPEKLFIGLFY